MNREDIIRMAAKSGVALYSMELNKEQFFNCLDRFAALVASAERKACAQIADQMTQHSYLGKVGQAIRARGQA